MIQYLVRFGSFGTLYRCHTPDPVGYARGQRVICRTPRGTEIGVVTAVIDPVVQENDSTENTAAVDVEGRIIRRTTTEDELLVDRLEKHRVQAVVRCQAMLAAAGSDATLLEVDPLFDGRTLLFFFLGPVGDEVQALTDELTAEYERNVRSKHFAKLLAEGCGPGCGTDEKAGGGCSGGCAVCVVAAACARPA